MKCQRLVERVGAVTRSKQNRCEQKKLERRQQQHPASLFWVLSCQSTFDIPCRILYILMISSWFEESDDDCTKRVASPFSLQLLKDSGVPRHSACKFIRVICTKRVQIVKMHARVLEA